MKKLIVIAAALIFATPVFAADEVWKMTGVMAVYPGIVNQPYSAPIVNNTEYVSETACRDAIPQIASIQPVIVSIVKGVMHAPQETPDGYVAVAADCFKQ